MGIVPAPADRKKEEPSMIGAIFLLGLSSFILAGEPEPFENYFDDSLKGVDISQDSAIKACLQNGDTLADKVKAAYDKCFGNDYDFDDLASNSGSSDVDSDGLPDSFEGNEACFYKEMNWVDASGTAAADTIKADMTGLEASEKAEFDNNIDACAAWSGSFGSRKKREVNVPEVMENDNKALNWLRSIVRKTRSADPGQKKKKMKKKVKSENQTKAPKLQNQAKVGKLKNQAIAKAVTAENQTKAAKLNNHAKGKAAKVKVKRKATNTENQAKTKAAKLENQAKVKTKATNGKNQTKKTKVINQAKAKAAKAAKAIKAAKAAKVINAANKENQAKTKEGKR